MNVKYSSMILNYDNTVKVKYLKLEKRHELQAGEITQATSHVGECASLLRAKAAGASPVLSLLHFSSRRIMGG